MIKHDKSGHGGDVPPRAEEFLKAVESKTTDEIHRRLLRVCRNGDPTASMEAELKRIIKEFLHEA